MKEQEPPGPPEIIRKIRDGGESVIATTQGGVLTSYMAGEGGNLRVAVNLGEIVPGTFLFEGGGTTEEAEKKFLAEMEEHGGKKIKVGADSPEVTRSVSGWSGRKWDENFDTAFSNDEPEE